MAVVIIGLAMVMRTEILAAFDGNWLPLAHFLLLVQAVASFDIRTRGGLYAGLALSAIVLFFASQQAFELSFGAFLLGYTALLMAFLATAFHEDATAGARLPSTHKGSLLGFWSGTSAAVLLLSVLAFLLIPRGENDAVGYEQVVALPITGTPLEAPPQAQVQAEPSSASPSSAEPEVGGAPSNGPRDAGTEPVSDTREPAAETPQTTSTQAALPANDSTSVPVTAAGEEVVMHVRSPVASYWRGQVFDRFDGRSWRGTSRLSPDRAAGHISEDPIRYTQTYFVRKPQSGITYMGYRGVQVLSPEDARYRNSLGKGFSYKVVSAQPDLVPEELRQDRPGRAKGTYYDLPASAEWVNSLSDRITAGDVTAFDKAESIVNYLRRNAEYNASAPDQLKSSAPLDAFLLDGAPGTSLDYATAAVLLARGAGLPARLAVGYLPGERDLLSGAYVVKERDAHAWAEIQFQEHGWVPFDGTHHPDLYAAGATRGGQLTGLRYLFESSVGDELIRQIVIAPSKLSTGLKDAFNSPASASLAALAAGAMLVVLVWFVAKALWKGRRQPDKRWAYSHLPGNGRDEMLRIYRRVERLLKKRGLQTRRPGQTLEEYSRAAAERLTGIEDHLAWFTTAA